MNRNKRAGDEYEREARSMMRDLLGFGDVDRMLGAGRKLDIGDIFAVPDTTIQVTGTKRDDYVHARAVTKLAAVVTQRQRAGTRHSAVWIRLPRGVWRVLVDQDEATRLGIVGPDIVSPDHVPTAIALRYLPELNVGPDHPVVFVTRIGGYAMTPETWVLWWKLAQRRAAGSAGVAVG